MTDGGMRRVLRSEELPAARVMHSADTARIRHQAIAGTSAAPELRQVEIAGRQVLMGRMTDGRVVAFSAFCPHQQTNLTHATFFEGYLRCPQHNYVYDLGTGRNLLPTRDARPELLWKLKPGYLTVYRVEERDGWIWVSATPQPPPSDYDPDAETKPAVSHRHFQRPVEPEDTGPVEHPCRDLEVTAGCDFEISLETKPVPGHIWKVEIDGDRVALVRQSFEAGPPAEYRLHMTAADAGRADLRCSYTKPWGADAREIRTFAITVTP